MKKILKIGCGCWAANSWCEKNQRGEVGRLPLYGTNPAERDRWPMNIPSYSGKAMFHAFQLSGAGFPIAFSIGKGNSGKEIFHSKT